MKVNVVKVGGKVIDDEKLLNQFLRDFTKLQGFKILVHGGGSTATKLADSLGIKTEMIDGRRITNDESINVVVMTYAGLINKKIVGRLQGLGCNSIGLTGADGNLILSEKRPIKDGIDYGWVGDPIEVNSNLFKSLLENEMIPVVSPLTHDGRGNLLNTNADTIANVISTALIEFFDVEMNYCFELKGVFKDLNVSESLIRDLNKESYQQLKEDRVVQGGMIPKLDNAFQAIDKGVKCVRILKYSDLLEIQEGKSYEYTLLR